MSLIPSGELKVAGSGTGPLTPGPCINESNSLRGVESVIRGIDIADCVNCINESNSLRGVERPRR